MGMDRVQASSQHKRWQKHPWQQVPRDLQKREKSSEHSMTCRKSSSRTETVCAALTTKQRQAQNQQNEKKGAEPASHLGSGCCSTVPGGPRWPVKGVATHGIPFVFSYRVVGALPSSSWCC